MVSLKLSQANAILSTYHLETAVENCYMVQYFHILIKSFLDKFFVYGIFPHFIQYDYN